MEDAVGAGGDGLVAEDAAGADHANRGLLLLHGAHLQRGGVRAEQHIGVQLDEESVLHVAGGVLLGEVEGGEDVPVVLDVRALHGGEADVLEDAAHLVHHQGDGVHGADLALRGGACDVGDEVGLLVSGGLDAGLELVVVVLGHVAQVVDQLTELLAVLLGHVLDFAEQGLDLALLAQELEPELLQRLCVLDFVIFYFCTNLVYIFHISLQFTVYCLWFKV